MFGSTTDPKRDAVIAKIKANEPPGGYKEIKTIWYITYLTFSAVGAITGAYYLSDSFLQNVPIKALMMICLAPFLAFGWFLMRLHFNKYNKTR